MKKLIQAHGMKISFCFIPFLALSALVACSPGGEAPAHAATQSDTKPSVSPLEVVNLTNNQQITEQTLAYFHIKAAPEIKKVKVSANGELLGTAVFHPEDSSFVFEHEFTQLGEIDLEFSGYGSEDIEIFSTATYRVSIVAKATPAPSPRLFNPYILKAVDYLNKNYGLLGYNINAQMTHPVNYHSYGVLKPTRDGLTMCVSGVLEVIITAFNIYAKEKGSNAIFDFLPFKSWSTLAETSIKAYIWVNPKLKSSGTGDAVAKFGLGEKVKFKDLEPGGFVNINRTTGSGHSVIFLSFIDKKGQDVAKYNSQVVGFRYFSAQGKGKKGEGGLGYRHAFFSKYGCPTVPFKRDCNVIFSDDSRLLNVGQMFHPTEWKHKKGFEQEEEREPLSPEEERMIHLPAEFDGLTTDD